ncbi:TPA: lipopolysaccharide biosynthesis protein [Vibrio cholerae]|nr:lipopolysaccharide biosynthesis protein [Vibrio cholerae]
MSLRQKAIIGFVWNVSDKLINQLGYLGVTIFIARLIGPESFGLIGMLTIFILLADSIVNNGFSQALIQKSQAITEEDTSTIFYVNIIIGVFLYILLYFSAPIVATFYNEPQLVEISRILFLVILVNSLSVVTRAKLAINLDFKSQTIVGALAVVIGSSVGLCLAFNNYGVWSLVWLTVSKSLVSSIGFWLFCRWAPKLIFSTRSFIQLFKFGSNLMLAGLGATLLNNFYIVFIGKYFNSSSVGYYTQAMNLSNFLSYFISSSLQGITYPIMTSIKDDKTRLIAIYKNLISITMMVSFPMLIGFSAISETAILLFLGVDWLPMEPILIALCLARAMTPISSINMNILNAIGRSDLFLKVDLVKYPLVIGGFLIGVNYGIEGIAWAMFVTAFMSFFINAYYPDKIFGFGGVAQLKAGYKYIISSLVMYFSIDQVSIGDNLLLALLVKVATGVVIYIIMMFLLRDKFFLNGIDLYYKKIKT